MLWRMRTAVVQSVSAAERRPASAGEQARGGARTLQAREQAAVALDAFHVGPDVAPGLRALLRAAQRHLRNALPLPQAAAHMPVALSHT